MNETADREAAVSIRDIAHAYGKRQALRGVSFDVARGEIFGLLGPNGGGKSTLFRILSTLLLPQRGTAHVLGQDVVTQRESVRRHLGVVFQSPALDGKLTVTENMRHQGHLFGLRGGTLRQRIDLQLRHFGLVDRAGDRVETLSGGLRRRVELAKSLLHEPQVLVLDEPSTGLDPGARLDLWQNLERVRRERRVTILLTSHLLEEAEKCDRVAILDRGELVTTGSPSRLKGAVGDDVITLTTQDAPRLAAGIQERFGLAPLVVDGSVRIEQGGTAAVLPRLVEAFQEDLLSVTLSKPTFEDVFIHFTGHRFEEARNEVD